MNVLNVLWLEKAAAADKPYSLEGRTDLSVCSTAGTRTPTADLTEEQAGATF